MTGEPGTPRFVARVAELATLRAAVERAASGEAATVIVSGEAGVGKSRLVEELMWIARGDGALVLLGRCVDIGEGELAFAPIAGALRSLAARVADDELEAALGPGREELVPLVPELAAEHAVSPAGLAPPGRARLFDLLLGALGRLGARRPVVLVIEELHWADGSTRDLLRFSCVPPLLSGWRWSRRIARTISLAHIRCARTSWKRASRPVGLARARGPRARGSGEHRRSAAGRQHRRMPGTVASP